MYFEHFFFFLVYIVAKRDVCQNNIKKRVWSFTFFVIQTLPFSVELMFITKHFIEVNVRFWNLIQGNSICSYYEFSTWSNKMNVHSIAQTTIYYQQSNRVLPHSNGNNKNDNKGNNDESNSNKNGKLNKKRPNQDRERKKKCLHLLCVCVLHVEIYFV